MAIKLEKLPLDLPHDVIIRTLAHCAESCLNSAISFAESGLRDAGISESNRAQGFIQALFYLGYTAPELNKLQEEYKHVYFSNFFKE